MKEGFDKEMDSLLRRRARGTAELRSRGDGPGGGLSGAHLDADELGAFAEGALPAAARGAAASHLADCDRCRGVVVGLARVAGAGVEVKDQAVAATSESARPSAWRAFVASLFAPRVLRYAAPVLGLSLVAVVSYVALRSNNGASMRTARVEPQQANAALKETAAPSTATNSAANTNTAGLVVQDNDAAQREAQATGAPTVPARGHGGAEVQPAEAVTAGEAEQPSAASPAPPPPAASAEGPAAPVMSKAAPKPVSTEEGEVARIDNKEKSENRDKSARAPEPAEDAASNDAAVQRSRAAQSRTNQVQMPDGGTGNNQKRAADNNTSTGYGNAGNAGSAAPPKDSDRERAGSRSESVSRARAAREAGQKTDDERGAQTRTAAGHRFRREGSAWVDVNYKQSMRSTGVRRGTEAFRALVADVPEVGRVAEAIGGEVIVVVGGRAYSIR
jgi:hypothetical protein